MSTNSPQISPQDQARKTIATWRWYLSPREWLRSVLRLNGTPHSIALGSAIGVFIAFTPTVGFQMMLVLLLAWICRPFVRFNQLAGLIAVYISNPITSFPIFYFNYWVGTFIFPSDCSREEIASLLQSESFTLWWERFIDLSAKVGLPMVVGSLIVGTVCALPTYPLIRWMVISVRNRRKRKTTA